MNKEALAQYLNSLGGSESRADYKKQLDPHYSDKGGHKQRSIANDPKHLNHWNKIRGSVRGEQK